MSSQLFIFTVIDRTIDNNRNGLFECQLQRWNQVLRFFNQVSDAVHGFRKFHKVRIGEINAGGTTVLIHLLPFNQSIRIIVENQYNDWQSFAERSFHFLIVHHKSAVAGDRQNLFLRIEQFCGNRSWNGDAHRRETVGNNRSVRTAARIMTGNPHFMCADIGDQDIFRTEYLADIPENLLRFNRKTHVIFVLLVFQQHLFPNGKCGLWLRCTAAAAGNPVKRIGDIADYFNLRLIILIDVCGTLINMYNGFRHVWVPFLRRVFNQIITDRKNQICVSQNLVLIILLRNADRPHGVRIIEWDNSLAHHGIDNRDFQVVGEACDSIGGMGTDCSRAGQHNRMLCLE